MLELRVKLVTALSAVVLLSLGGCPDEVETSCQPGVTNPCTCADGASGVSTCGDDHSFGTCVCTDPDAGDVSGDFQNDTTDGSVEDIVVDSPAEVSETGDWPPAPENVSASDGTYANEVEITWDESEGATSYSILRDDIEIANDIEMTTYHDTMAEQMAPLGDTLNLTATDNEQERILLNWELIEEVPTLTHSYVVVAVGSDGSTPSLPDTGHRQASDVFTYELQVDGAGDWVALGNVHEHDYAVTQPDQYAQITSMEVSTTWASVSVSAISTTGNAEVGFAIRGVNAVGPGEPCDQVIGQALPPTFVTRWDRSTDASDDPTYLPVAEATTNTIVDTDVATNGEGRRYRYVITVGTHGTVTSETELVGRVVPVIAPSALTAGSNFGTSVAFDGDNLVVGAPGHDTAGAAWIFAYHDTEPYFPETAMIANPGYGELFGTSVAVDEQVVVGSPGETAPGAVLVYSPAGSYLDFLPDNTTPADPAPSAFGATVATAGDYVFVSETSYNSDEGRVYVYHTADDLAWAHSETPIADIYLDAGDRFGTAISVYGDDMAIGAPYDETDTGIIHLFHLDTGSWTYTGQLFPPIEQHGHFGMSVSYRATEILVGSPTDGSAGTAYHHVYDDVVDHMWLAGVHVAPGDRVEGEAYGSQVILGDDWAVVSSPAAGSNAGRIAIFDETVSGFVLRESLTEVTPAADRRFGDVIAVSHGWLFVGVPTNNDGRGAVYAYYLGLD